MINVEDHVAHCRMAREIIIIKYLVLNSTTRTQNIRTVWIESLYANFPYISGQSGTCFLRGNIRNQDKIPCVNMGGISVFVKAKVGEQGSCLAGKTPGFPSIRYASQVLQIRSQYLNPGNHRAFSLNQSSTIIFLCSWF